MKNKFFTSLFMFPFNLKNRARNSNPKLSNNKKVRASVGGFTLLELLVSMVIATTIVGTLLSFLATILETDRREQAKANSQEEIQAAIDYIADDLLDAVYIYDANALDNNSPNGIKDQIRYGTTGDTDTTKVPVLVFWKRYFYTGTQSVTTAANGNQPLNCVKSTTCTGTDEFVYSLVAYYLVKDSNANWSSSSRIVRWELRDGIKSNCASATDANSTNCSWTAQRVGLDTAFYYVLPDRGFRRYTTPQTPPISAQMNQWQYYTSEAYNTNAEVLVDFVDDTPNYLTDAVNPANGIVNPIPSNCDNETGTGSTLIPSTFASTGTSVTSLNSFYACVNSSGERSVAKVFLRGNALVRLQGSYAKRVPGGVGSIAATTYSSFISTASARVTARGLIAPPQ